MSEFLSSDGGGSVDSSSKSGPIIPLNSPLHSKWNYYYHLPNDKSWELSSYRMVLKNIERVDQLVAVNNAVPEHVVKYCMLFVMRKGITPMWEDAANRNGGCFSFKVINKQVFQVWRSLLYALCGESLFVDKSHLSQMNGITISPKKNFCIVKIWMRGRTVQDPNTIINVPGLSKQGCLFKCHEPEF